MIRKKICWENYNAVIKASGGYEVIVNTDLTVDTRTLLSSLNIEHEYRIRSHKVYT